MLDTRAFETALWADVEGDATEEQRALLEADEIRWARALDLLIGDVEERLDAVRRLPGEERDQVVADFEDELAALEAAFRRATHAPEPPPPPAPAPTTVDPQGEVRLQASWSGGQVVVWAAGPGAAPLDNDGLADRLEAIQAPADGWALHKGVPLPSGQKAAAVSMPIDKALGWLVLGLDTEGLGSSITWLGRVALEAVRLLAKGSIVPHLHVGPRRDGGQVDLRVRWTPALVDQRTIAGLAAARPHAVAALGGPDAKAMTMDVLGAVVDAVVADAARRLEVAAPPPVTRTASDVAEAFLTRLDGSTFSAPIAAGAEVSKRIDRWARPVTAGNRPRLVVQLDPPDAGDAWLLSVLGPSRDGAPPQPIEVALADATDPKPLADELTRVERLLPALVRAGSRRRGQVVLNQVEAWELMTVTGNALADAGFDVRVPALSRRKPKPSLRLFTEPAGDTVVGAHQLANVRWTALFDDVELTAAEIARLATEARPLVRSRGQWVELDRADLKEAAASLAERADQRQLTGAEILRHAIGLESSGLAGGLVVDGSGWASDLLERAKAISTEPVTEPEGFVGSLRSYQAEAVAWLGFLDATELGGCLALDMGLGKTPTVLAHVARTAGDADEPALVIAPPAVVGNWAREAARFAPKLHVVVHHGAARASTAEGLDRQIRDADLVITTYGTAVRDIEALSARHWSRVVLDEAQAIKTHTSETAQQLRRLQAGTRLALTGTPIENGLGDLWSILDFTNPGLVGTRASFVAQLSGEGEEALRALNGILTFRRTKSEPEVAAELPDKIDELDHCSMTAEQIGLYQAVLDQLVADASAAEGEKKQGAVLAAITALKQICNHPVNYQADDRPLAGRSGKLTRLEEIVEQVFEAGEKVLVFTHFATWGLRLAEHLTAHTGVPVHCYHGGLARGARDKLVEEFQQREGPAVLVLSLKAGGTGLNLTAASHVVLYDRWWNPAVEDQARDRAWRIGQTKTVVSHRLVCPGTIDERVEEVVAGKRHIADLVLPKSSSLSDLDPEQLRTALGLRTDTLLTEEAT